MHQIEFLTFGPRKSEKTITKECAKYADRNGDYKGQITGIRFSDMPPMKTYQNAVEWIESHDRGWYDCLAIKYKEKGRLYWLVKIEFHT